MLPLVCGCVLSAQTPADETLDGAYAALRERRYEQAASLFRQAVAARPDRAATRKDLAYTLLKIGENEEARDQFGEAMRQDATDFGSALEYAFLCYETRRVADARRTFDWVRTHATGPDAATAAQGFENVDRPLREGIERWLAALKLTPDNFSGHEELAKLAAERDQLVLAAEHFESAWRIRPDERRLLVDLARALRAQGKTRESTAALLAASRNAEPFAAEAARELLPKRYPYAYEFEDAIRLDPTGVPLRREYGFFLLELKRAEEAQAHFREVIRLDPTDQLAGRQLRLLAAPTPQGALKDTSAPAAESTQDPAKVMGIRSLEKSFLADAKRYLTIANEENPEDTEVMLKLGWTYNALHQDEEAMRWFARARHSNDPAVAAEADRAWRNLRPKFARVRLGSWMFPLYSSRWDSTFLYGQVKTEFRVGSLPLKPYLSARFIGDLRVGPASTTDPVTPIGPLGPAYLSERAIIAAFGAMMPLKHRLLLWGEAGEAFSYMGHQENHAFAVPDYRGGLSYFKGWGNPLGGESAGLFADVAADGVFVSRFQNDLLLTTQSRAGYTGRTVERLGGLQWQYVVHGNVTTDVKHQYWANFYEFGPGVRFRWRWMPPSLHFNAQCLYGTYLVLDGNPHAPHYRDIRGGLWYAFSR
jgi:tetratricopeptide (TPR) repeat protein